MKSQTLILAPVLIICFGLLQKAHAINQPPDRSYPGFNTVEAQDALFSLDVVTGFAKHGSWCEKRAPSGPAADGGYKIYESVLVDIRVGAITGIATNGTQTGATSPL
jgi:hypothetical protein